jgi:hypothetical protein
VLTQLIRVQMYLDRTIALVTLMYGASHGMRSMTPAVVATSSSDARRVTAETACCIEAVMTFVGRPRSANTTAGTPLNTGPPLLVCDVMMRGLE